jgi:hypothetical protein
MDIEATTLEEKSKPKGLLRGRVFPMDFVSPLQLEECIYRVNNRVRDYGISSEIKPDIETGDAEFVIAIYRGERVVSMAWGNMRRWEGVSTHVTGKVKAEGELNYSVLWVFLGLVTSPIPMLIFGYFIGLVLPDPIELSTTMRAVVVVVQIFAPLGILLSNFSSWIG